MTSENSSSAGNDPTRQGTPGAPVATAAGSAQRFDATGREKALFDWMARPPERGTFESSFLFDAVRDRDDGAGVISVGDKVIKTYVDGTKLREYTFALQINMNVSKDNDETNMDNMARMRTWQAWIAEKAAAGEFPDFGESCGGYRLKIGDAAPQKIRHGETVATYNFFAAIQYYEKNKEGF